MKASSDPTWKDLLVGTVLMLLTWFAAWSPLLILSCFLK